MRSELVELQRQLGITTLYVTHDQTEAMTMSDRIALMMGGQIVQTGSPSEIFHDPAHLSVASFVGTPRINLLPATIEDGRVHCLGIALPIARAERDIHRCGLPAWIPAGGFASGCRTGRSR